MAFPGIEPTTSHLTYLLLSCFLIFYAIFSDLIRNRLHLSEPPLATLLGITFGPRGATTLNPISWGWQDNITQEITRVILGVQVFAIGFELPKKYMKEHIKGVLVLLSPVMTYGWLASTLIIYLVLNTSFTTALIIAACLTPTDPVLSASVLGEANFSKRVPKRIKNLLAAESGCNDGVSFPFLYLGLIVVTSATAGAGAKEYILQVLFWKCLLGTLFGLVIGKVANMLLRFSEARQWVHESTFLVFYLLLALLCVGIGSSLGLDDFLVAFGAGTSFGWDGWFSRKSRNSNLPGIIDILLNTTMFVYFGTVIPWDKYTGNLNVWKLLACLLLILLLRRIPALLAMKRFTPDIKTYSEALFCGHFGPIGIGALFLAIEARAWLETETSVPLPQPPDDSLYSGAIDAVWPVICFMVLGSIMVHGVSAAVMSVASHFSRDKKERAPLLGTETDRLYGMAGENGQLHHRREDTVFSDGGRSDSDGDED